MTSVVGVLCKDGVVLGTDSSVTFSDGTLRTIEQPTKKLAIIDGCIIVAGTGDVGLGQRFCYAVEQLSKKGLRQYSCILAAEGVSHTVISDFRHTFAQMGRYGALVAFPSTEGIQLCEFAIADLQPEFKTSELWYASMGSAQVITDPFLAFMREVYWPKGPPTVQEAVFAVTWTLDHAVQINPGGVNAPLQIAVLEGSQPGEYAARELSQDELGEHRQCIEDAKNALRGLRARHRNENDVQDIPKFTDR